MHNIFLILILVFTSINTTINTTISASSVEKRASVKKTDIKTEVKDQRLLLLHELFTTLGVKVNRTYEAMNAYAQANWLRKPGQERWHIEKQAYHPNLNQIIPILQKLGMIDRIDPSIDKPDYAWVLGATVYRMRTRMQHVIELISAGRFKPKQIIVLVGDRPLDPVQESPTVLMDKKFIRSSWECLEALPTTEYEASKWVWDQLPKPECIKDIPITFLRTPMLEKNGKIVRPTTADTVEQWIKTSPSPGSIVAFSNNPYVVYQHETMKPSLIKAGWFKAGGTLETVGTECTLEDGDKETGPLLDNVARYIYSILQVEKALASQ